MIRCWLGHKWYSTLELRESPLMVCVQCGLSTNRAYRKLELGPLLGDTKEGE